MDHGKAMGDGSKKMKVNRSDFSALKMFCRIFCRFILCVLTLMMMTRAKVIVMMNEELL
jgi:hypothetical protein